MTSSCSFWNGVLELLLSSFKKIENDFINQLTRKDSLFDEFGKQNWENFIVGMSLAVILWRSHEDISSKFLKLKVNLRKRFRP